MTSPRLMAVPQLFWNMASIRRVTRKPPKMFTEAMSVASAASRITKTLPEPICSSAPRMMIDEMALVIPDPEHSYDEDRFVLLGMSQRPRLLVVVHCYRESESTIRLVSARRATRTETKQYVSGRF